tara:strand:- start:1276 stop:1443 length:168 start_codon:yes stop_codon:yes gene_type:complete
MKDTHTQIIRVTGIAVITGSIGYVGNDPVILGGAFLMMSIVAAKIAQLISSRNKA